MKKNLIRIMAAWMAFLMLWSNVSVEALGQGTDEKTVSYEFKGDDFDNEHPDYQNVEEGEAGNSDVQNAEEGESGDSDEQNTGEDEESSDEGNTNEQNGQDEEESEDAELDSTDKKSGDDTELSLESSEKNLQSNTKSSVAGEVSRIAWIEGLIETFGLSVEEDNYPDNYYSDLDSSSEYYRKIMIATEFGLIDVEAGDAAEPDKDVTREYAAFSLNKLVGYVNDASYSFSEVDEVTYPDDIQVAINQGWLEPEGDNFLPDQVITEDEKNNMLKKGSEVIDHTTIDSSNNQYAFLDHVIILDESKVKLTGENQLTIEGKDTQFEIGDVIGLVSENIPYAWKVSAIEDTDDGRIVTTAHVDIEDAFSVYDVEASLDVDLTQITTSSQNADIVYIVGGTEVRDYEDGEEYFTLESLGNKEISAVRIDNYYDCKEDGTIISDDQSMETAGKGSGYHDEYNLTDASKIRLSATISNVKVDYKGGRNPFFKIDGRISLSFSANIDMIKASGLPSSFIIMYMPIGYVAYESVNVKISLTGEMTLNYVADFSAGVQYEKSGIRVISSFKKKEFTIQQDLQCSVALVAQAGFDIHVLGGRVYAEIGGKAQMYSRLHDAGTVPQKCTHVKAWMFADVGYSVWLDKSLGGKDYGKQLVLYDFNNSPVRVEYHYEDGHLVDQCSLGGFVDESTGKKVGKYTTPANSRYGYSGASKGKDSSGNSYTIFTYTLNSNDQATITGYKGTTSAIKIPDTLDGYEVVAIGESAFKGNTTLRYVGMTDNITKIAGSAFKDCKNLTDVQLSYKLVKLGTNAFGNCTSLQAIEIPKSLQGGSAAFSGCSNLKNVTFEEGITTIPNWVLRYCPGIEKIVIPDTVTNIGEYAFAECTNLKEVVLSQSLLTLETAAFSKTAITKIEIPDSVTSIWLDAFQECSKLKEVKLSKNISRLAGDAFKDCISLESIEIPKSLQGGSAAFSGCSNLKKVTFEEGTTMIPRWILRYCPGIEKIVIPNTVTIIGSYAFDECTNLKEVVLPQTLLTIEEFAFSETAITEIEIPDSVTKIGERVFGNCSKLGKVKFPAKSFELGNRAFQNCTSLKEIEIPKSLKESDRWNENGPFTGCNNLKKVSFEEGITTIPHNILSYCSGIEEIVIPDTVTSIGDYAFAGSKNLKKVTLPKELVTIGDSAFRETPITEITFPETVTKIDDNAFRGCSSLEEIIVPDAVTDLGERVFQLCSKATKIQIPNTLKEIPAYAFCNCSKLAKINLPDTLNNVDAYAFYNCDALEEIELPDGVTNIGEYAFYDCDAMGTMIMPTVVKKIGTYAFAGCDVLKKITIGENITEIPSYAFYNCVNLEEVTVPYKVTKINAYAFADSPKLAKIVIPRNVTSIVASAFSYPSVMSIYGVTGTYAETFATQNGYTFVNHEVKAESVEIIPSALDVNCGYTTQLNLKITPGNFTDEVSWKSADTSIATVDKNGLVKGIAKGSTVIKVNVGNVSKTCNVTVKQPVTSLRLSPSSKTMNAGEELPLKATVYPSDASNKDLSWKSSASEIVSVDENGKIKALKKGTAKITVTAQDGTGRYATCEVTVLNSLFVVNGEEDFESSHPYENNCQDIWEYVAEEATKISITFSDDTSVEENFDFIYIYDGRNKQIGKYTGKILAGKTITVTGNKIRVKLVSDDAGNDYGFSVIRIQEKQKDVALKKISISENQLSMKCEESKQLEVIYEPENTTIEKNVIWASSDDSVVTVENGLVTAQAQGEAIITATVGGKKATCVVMVVPRITELEISVAKNEIKVGEISDIIVRCLPKGYLPIDELIYENENSEIVSVENHLESGYLIVRGNTIGTAKINIVVDELEEEVEISVVSPELLFYTGEELYDKKDQVYGEKINLAEPPQKDCYLFGGWYTELDGKGELVTENSVYKDQSKVYAYWVADEGKMWVRPLGDYTYTGKAIKPAVQVYDGTHLLQENIDYKLTYVNNTVANSKYHDALESGENVDLVTRAYGKKMPYVKVAGKGNYKETQIVYFSIMPKNIGDDDVAIDESQLVRRATKKTQKLVPTIKWNGKVLKKNKDFTTTYPDENAAGAYVVAGQYSVIVQGTGNYCGSRETMINLIGQSQILMSKVSVKSISNQEWDGKEKEPEVKVFYGKQQLKEGEEYRLEYYNNKEIGKAYVDVIGMGRFVGTKKLAFKINGMSISKAKVSGLTDQIYSGTEQKQEQLTIVYMGETLQKDIDYTVSYEGNVNAGKAKVIITGMNGYSGKITKNFKIKPYSVLDKEVTVDQENTITALYCKGGAKPKLTVRFNGKELSENTDYKLSYKNNSKITDASTGKYAIAVIKGLKNFMGEYKVIFEISDSPMTGKVSVMAEDVLFKAQKNKWKSKEKVYDIDGKQMQIGKDYNKAVSYTYASDATMLDGSVRIAGTEVAENDIPLVGTEICVAVTGLNNYRSTDSASAVYRIVEKNISKAKFTVMPQTYTGQDIMLEEEDFVQALMGKEDLQFGVDYEIVPNSYVKNQKKGTASVVIHGIGTYGGTKKITFKIGAKNIY